MNRNQVIIPPPPEQFVPDQRVLTLQDPSAAPQDQEAAFAGIYKEFAGPLKGYVLNMVGSDEQAEDIVQESLLNAWKGIHKFDAQDENSSLRAWIYRITRNKTLNSMRGPKNRTGKGDVSYEDTHVANPDLHGSSDGNPLARLIAREEFMVIGTLSEPEQEALSWDLDTFTYEEIAQQNGMTVGAVKSRLVRAREARRKATSELELSEAEKEEIKAEKARVREERRQATLAANRQKREQEERALVAA